MVTPCLASRDFSEMRTAVGRGILGRYLYLSFVASTVAEIKYPLPERGNETGYDVLWQGGQFTSA